MGALGYVLCLHTCFPCAQPVGEHLQVCHGDGSFVVRLILSFSAVHSRAHAAVRALGRILQCPPKG